MRNQASKQAKGQVYFTYGYTYLPNLLYFVDFLCKFCTDRDYEMGFDFVIGFYTNNRSCRWFDSSIILPVFLYGCETWSLTLRDERRLRVFENRVVRRVFGPKRDEVTGEWRKLHKKKLSDLYSLPNIVRVVKSRRMRWTRHVARMREGRVVHRVMVGKPEWKRPLGRPRRRSEDNIKMGLQEVGGSLGD